MIPFFSLSISLFLICHTFKVNFRQYTQFFFLTSIFSTFLVTPLLSIPFFGFLPYFTVIEGSHVIYWIYLNHAERSSSVASLLIMLSINIFIVQYYLGCFVFSRILKLPFKKCITVFFCTALAGILITICSGMIFFG